MIEIYTKHKLKNIPNIHEIKTYSKNMIIPIELSTLAGDKNTILSYILEIKKAISYLRELVNLTEFVKLGELEIREEQKKYFLPESSYQLELELGKQIFSRCKSLSLFSLAPVEIKAWIQDKELKLMSLYKDYKYIDEFEIYRNITSDFFILIQNEFRKYFICNSLISENTKSLFIIEEDIFLYFVPFENQSCYRNDYRKSFYEAIQDDFNDFSKQISNTIQLIKMDLSNSVSDYNDSSPLSKFFKTHNATSVFFEKLEIKGLIEKSEKYYRITKGNLYLIVTLCCYLCSEANPTYDLYGEIFENLKMRTNQRYKYKRTNDKDYMEKHIIPLANELCK